MADRRPAASPAPLAVRAGEDGAPRAVCRRGRWQRVARVLEEWRDVGCWWDGEPEKAFYRLELEGGELVEVYRELPAGPFHLYRAYD